MQRKDLRQRTKAFAIRIMRVCDAFPRTRSGNIVANQLVRSGTSPGAQYRECVHFRSSAEALSKMLSALQELEETVYWLEIIVDSRMLGARRLASLQREAQELTAIFMTCVRKLKSGRRR